MSNRVENSKRVTQKMIHERNADFIGYLPTDSLSLMQSGEIKSTSSFFTTENVSVCQGQRVCKGFEQKLYDKSIPFLLYHLFTF